MHPPAERRAARAARAAERGHGENADIEIGGPGSGPRQFLELRDRAFRPDGRRFVLEGRREDNQSKPWADSCRIHVLDETARFLDQFPIADARLDGKHDPSRWAVDAASRVFVAEPSNNPFNR